MSNFENFPTSENKEEEKKVSKFEDEDEFEEKEKEKQDDENETQGTNKSKGSRSGWKVGLLSALALSGAVAKEKSAEDMFTDKKMDKTEQMIKTEMEKDENAQEMSEGKFKIKKVKDIMTEEQLNKLVDSTGMISISELVSKLLRYSSGLIAIDKNDPDIRAGVQKFAKNHRIPGSVQIYVLGNGELAGASTYETDTGKTKDILFRIGQVSEKFTKDEINNIQFIFNSK